MQVMVFQKPSDHLSALASSIIVPQYIISLIFPVKKYQLTLVRSELLRTIDTLVLAPFHLMGFLTQRQWVGCLLLAQQRLSIAVFWIKVLLCFSKQNMCHILLQVGWGVRAAFLHHFPFQSPFTFTFSFTHSLILLSLSSLSLLIMTSLSNQTKSMPTLTKSLTRWGFPTSQTSRTTLHPQPLSSSWRFSQNSFRWVGFILNSFETKNHNFPWNINWSTSIQSHPFPFKIYSAKMEIHAQLSGLRHIMWVKTAHSLLTNAQDNHLWYRLFQGTTTRGCPRWRGSWQTSPPWPWSSSSLGQSSPQPQLRRSNHGWSAKSLRVLRRRWSNTKISSTNINLFTISPHQVTILDKPDVKDAVDKIETVSSWKWPMLLSRESKSHHLNQPKPSPKPNSSLVASPAGCTLNLAGLGLRGGSPVQASLIDPCLRLTRTLETHRPPGLSLHLIQA